MFNLFKTKKRITDEIREIPLKIKVNSDVNSGEFLKGFDGAKKVKFKDPVVNAPAGKIRGTFRFMEDDLKIIDKLSKNSIDRLDMKIAYIGDLNEFLDNDGHNGTNSEPETGEYCSDPYNDFPAVMFDTDEIINDHNLVSLGRSRVTGQHVYRYLGNGPKDLDNIGIPFSELL